MRPAQTIVASPWPVWLNAAALLLASLIAVAALAFRAGPGVEVVAVAFPPWWTSQRTFEAAASADAAIVRTTGIAAILVVRPNDHDGLTRLRAAGAWLTLDPQAIAACFSHQTKDI